MYVTNLKIFINLCKYISKFKMTYIDSHGQPNYHRGFWAARQPPHCLPLSLFLVSLVEDRKVWEASVAFATLWWPLQASPPAIHSFPSSFFLPSLFSLVFSPVHPSFLRWFRLGTVQYGGHTDSYHQPTNMGFGFELAILVDSLHLSGP